MSLLLMLSQKVNDPNSEKLSVSLQRLSKCDEHLSGELPWMGHSTTRRRRQIRRKSKLTNQLPVSESDTEQSTDVTSKVPEEEEWSVQLLDLIEWLLPVDQPSVLTTTHRNLVALTIDLNFGCS